MVSNAVVRSFGYLLSSKILPKSQKSLNISASIFTSASSLSRMAPANPIRPLVICGPSGVGKSTIVNDLLKEFPNVFGFSVSHTTRKPREGEQEGVSYHYVDRESMLAAISRGEFIENAEFSGNLYGTSHAAVRNVQKQGRICILDIEIQGVMQMKKTDLNPHYVFIKPPSMEELEKRLRGRNTETEESIQRRLATARADMKYVDEEGAFDLVIVNDDIDVACKTMRDFMLPFIKEVQEYQKAEQ